MVALVQKQHIPEESELKIRDEREPGYFWADNEIVDQFLPKIGMSAFAVYMLLVRMSNHGKCTPSINTLATRLGISKPTVRKSLDALQEHRLIGIQERTRSKPDGKVMNYTNSYTINRVAKQSDLSLVESEGGGKNNLPPSQNILLGVVNHVDPNNTKDNNTIRTIEEDSIAEAANALPAKVSDSGSKPDQDQTTDSVANLPLKEEAPQADLPNNTSSLVKNTTSRVRKPKKASEAKPTVPRKRNIVWEAVVVSYVGKRYQEVLPSEHKTYDGRAHKVTKQIKEWGLARQNELREKNGKPPEEKLTDATEKALALCVLGFRDWHTSRTDADGKAYLMPNADNYIVAWQRFFATSDFTDYKLGYKLPTLVDDETRREWEQENLRLVIVEDRTQTHGKREMRYCDARRTGALILGEVAA